MIFDSKSQSLYADTGEFLKTVHCPMALKLQDLAALPRDAPDRFCHHCNKPVRCADGMTDADMQEALKEDESLCVFATPHAKNIVLLRPQPYGWACPNTDELPVIQTARTLAAMNDGVQRGLWPLLRKAGPTSVVGESCCLFQNRTTGAVHDAGHGHAHPCEVALDALYEDVLFERCSEEEYQRARAALVDPWERIEAFHYRPDWPFPYAAYLIPRDIKIGDRVFLEDLIEDVPQSRGGPAGASGRVLSSEATWAGQQFELPPLTMSFVG